MYTKYSCAICSTAPDQLSHHNAHLNTNKHKKNKECFIRDMKIWSIPLRQIHPKKWDESEEKEYILEKYKKEKNKPVDYEASVDEVSKWIMSKTLLFLSEIVEDRSFPILLEDYHKFTGIKLDMEQLSPRNIHNEHYIEFSNWAINEEVKKRETIKTEEKPIKYLTGNLKAIRSFTNVSTLLESVVKGNVVLDYLLEPIHCGYNNAKRNNHLSLYDLPVKYACILFNYIGTWRVHFSDDLEKYNAFSERNPYHQSLLFYKKNENVERTIRDDSETWFFMDMDLTNEQIIEPQHIYSTIINILASIYQYQIDNPANSEEKQYYLVEQQNLLSMGPALARDVIKVCEFLFIYNEELIKYYHKYTPAIIEHKLEKLSLIQGEPPIEDHLNKEN
jgi:hypothetical protein